MKAFINSGFIRLLRASNVSIFLIANLFASAQTPVSVENSAIRLEIFPDNGEIRVLDKKTAVWWESGGKSFGSAVFRVNGKREEIEFTKCRVVKKDSAIEMGFDVPGSDKKFIVKTGLIKSGNAIDFSYTAAEGVFVERVNFGTFSVRNIDDGYFVIPVREGLIIPAGSGKAFTHTFNTYTYEGCHMAMFGAVKNQSAIMANWRDPYLSVVIESKIDKNQQTLSSIISMSKTATNFQIYFLGKGSYVDIGKYYREVAKSKGWFVNWDEKLKENPQRSLLFGAANIKLWSLLSRRMSEDSTKEISKRVNWTFEEAAEIAEHIKYDLGIEKVLFTIGGWIHRGYDNQHPDILPAAPECGGNDKLAECSKRVQKLGYLFCLHDNYQDIYRDSPSWNEDYIMKSPDGKLVPGGVWAGGRAYLTCSQKALELAKRPQNLPAVKALTGANSYFIDTTYAAGLYECFDPKHPLTRWDDMKWKQALSDYARSLFGVFGSECGREWAIPHSDFFEGLTGVSGRHFHDAGLENKVGGYVVPLFEVVYRDCIAMYGKYGYDPNSANGYVLDHIIYGRPLNYHSIPAGIYWKKPIEENSEIKIKPYGAEFQMMSADSFQIAYIWDVQQPVNSDWTIFVHFTDKNGKILFQNDHKPEKPISQWSIGKIRTGPFTVKVPDGLTPPFDVRVGMFKPEQGPRARLIGKEDGESRYILGVVKRSDGGMIFEQSQVSTDIAGVFVKSDNGWAQGLHPMDRFIKNTCEILNPLNEITARMPMTDHKFLSKDKKIQQSVFGSGANSVNVVVNYSTENFSIKSKFTKADVVLPPYGFVIESPAFIAFHALVWNGINYDKPTLFTMKSLDGRDISRSKKVRIFHGFGDDRIRINSKIYSVKREEVISF
ncbi:MAG: DUF5696 domain-containing protein [Verrucomicrobiia bacterium]